MTTVTHSRRILKTGRPLGLIDVFSKIAENARTAVSTFIVSLFRPRTIARATRLAEEAAALRRLADMQRDRCPGFASDLYAAADRHELIG